MTADVAKAKGLARGRFNADPRLKRLEVEVGGQAYEIVRVKDRLVLVGVRPVKYPELHPSQVGAGH
jgi:hypothetical protein